MIVVTVSRENGLINGYQVSGHAGFNPRGEDIVCAAVSMLAQTTLLGLNHFIPESFTFSIEESGKLRCRLRDGLDEKQVIQTQAILQTMIIGLNNLQKNYNKHIKLFRRRWTS